MPEDTKPTDDILSQEFDSIFKMDDLYRVILDNTMFRNILYYLGEQWLDWFANSGTFGRRYEINMNVPTPVSNIIRDTVKSMKALTMNKEYVARVWPNSIQQKDKDAAKLAEQVCSYLESRRDGEASDTKELVELWRQVTGNGFFRTFPDMGGGAYLVDKKGNTIGNTGDVKTECLIPFNVVVPALGTTLREKAYVGIKSIKEREWVEDTFKIKLATGDGDKQLVDYQKQLMTLVANVSPWKGRGIDTGTVTEDTSKLVVYEEIEWRPTKKFTKGRYAARAGGTIIINDDKLPLPIGDDGSWEYTPTHVPYNQVPGSFWASSFIDDLISPQNIINEVDQALAINRKSLGRPWVLTPVGLSLKRISARGSSLLAVEYDGLTAQSPPTIQRGTPYPNQILDERLIHRQVAQDSTGDPKNVLRGQSPYAGAPGIAIDMLREAAEQSHTPDVKRFYRAYAQVKRKELLVVQSVVTEQRILKIIGPGNSILVKKFKGSNLHNNTDVRLELASGAAFTNAGRTEMIMQLLQYGFFDPRNVAISEDLRREILKLLGLSSFEEAGNLHKEKAEYENSVLMGDDIEELSRVALPSGIPATDPVTGKPLMNPESPNEPLMEYVFPPTHDNTFRFDNHASHIDVLDKLILSREFQSISPEKQERIIAHRDMHKGALRAQIEEEKASAVEEQQAITNAQEPEKPAEQEGQGYSPEPFVAE